LDLQTGQVICVKRAIVATDGRAESTAREEAALLERFNGSSSIVSYLGSDFCGQGRNREAYLVMEYCSKGHLFGVLSKMQAQKKK
jgi:serine/threonine protein kinase